MRVRLLTVAASVACMLGAASWAPLAHSQSSGTPVDTSQSDADVPVVTVPYPDDSSPSTTTDNTDDGTPAPTPTPAPKPAPVAPVVTPTPVAPVVTPSAQPTAQSSAPTVPTKELKQPKLKPNKPAPSSAAVVPTPRIDTVAPTTGGAAQPAQKSATKSDGTPTSGPYKNLKPYRATEHKAQMLAITAGGAGTLAALAAGLGAGAAGGAGRRRTSEGRGGGGGGSGGGGGGGGEDGGWLEDVELEREGGHRFGQGWGDRSRTWRWGLTRRIDRFSSAWPDKLSRFSPVIGRVSLDGDYLRAMLGGLYLLFFPLAIVLGVAAAGSAGDAVLPPAFGFFVAILALSVFDSMLGYLAAIAFAITAALHGSIDSAAALRELGGLTLIWFAMPLSAAAMRPLRRNLNLKIAGLWDRSADLVLAGLFAAWIAANQVSALGPLVGYEVPIANRRWTIALIVLAIVAVRVLLESAAAHFYPKRLAMVEAQGELEPPKAQEAISLVIQIGVLMYITSSWLGWNWALFVGTVVFFTPLVPWLFVDKLPKSKFIAKWMPAGLAKWAWVIITSILASKLLDRYITDPQAAINWGYILLPLPVLFIWGLELFAAEDEEEEEDEEAEGASADAEEEEEEEGRFPMTWPLRLAGVPITALCFYLVVYVIG